MRTKLFAGAVLAALAGPVHALPISDLPADVTVFMAGAAGLISNFDAVLGVPSGSLVVGNQVCAAGTSTKYQDPGTGSNMVAYFCNAGPATGLPPTTKVLLYFRGSGGSPFGVDPVGQYSIGFYKLDALTSQCLPHATNAQTFVCSTWNNNVLSQDYITRIPDAGFSLIEPTVLVGPSSNIPLPSQCQNTFFIDPCPQGLGFPGVGSSQPILVQGTIIAVNALMRQHLMAMQGLTGNQVPSLTRAEVRSIFTEANILSNGPTNPNWSFLSNVLRQRFPSGTQFSGPMGICRGINGLGTAAAFNAALLSAPCASGQPGGQLTFVSTSKPGIQINILPSVAQVLTCLQTFQGTPPQAPVAAIGMLTIDQLTRATQAGLSYVNIDGRPMLNTSTIDDPSIQSGEYDLWSETFMQMSNDLVFNGGNQFAFMDAFQTALQTTTPGLGVYNVKGYGTSKPMFVTRGGNSCSPALY